jgi:hypothetical protein
MRHLTSQTAGLSWGALRCGLLLALVLPAYAAPPTASAERLLIAALRGPTKPFEGRQRATVTLDAGPISSDIRIFGDGRGRIRREYESGSAAGVISLQAEGSVWQRAGEAEWTQLPGSPMETDPAASAAAIRQNYRVEVGPETRLLNRPVAPIRIEPRQKYNPSRRLWLDIQTGMILRDELYAPDGRLRSATVFTFIAFRPQPANLFTPPAEHQHPSLIGPASFSARRSRAEVESETGRPVFLPAYIPAGYRVALYGVMQTGSGRKMPAVRYSDGLAAFTVFQRGRGGPGGGRGFGRGGGQGRGPGQGRGLGGGAALRSGVQQSVVNISTSRASYLLIGDLAEDELRRVAQSLP